MKRFTLEAGTVVHIQGIPFYLCHHTTFEGHQANVAMVTMEDPDTPDFRVVINNIMRPWWKRMLRIR